MQFTVGVYLVASAITFSYATFNCIAGMRYAAATLFGISAMTFTSLAVWWLTR